MHLTIPSSRWAVLAGQSIDAPWSGAPSWAPGPVFNVIEFFSVENVALLQHSRCSHCNSFTGAFYNLHVAWFPITNASKMMAAALSYGLNARSGHTLA